MDQKPKPITMSLIERIQPEGDTHTAYLLLDEVLATYHSELVGAKIGLLWRYNWKEDSDGRLKLGEAMVCSEVLRELSGYDLLVSLNYKAWKEMRHKQQVALLDHELMHIEVCTDGDGEVRVDEKGRVQYRTRKHDLEEFHEIVRRHGLWKKDVSEMYRAMEETKARPLLKSELEGEQRAAS